MLQDMQAATETGAAEWQPFCDRSSVRCVSDIARTIFTALFTAIFFVHYSARKLKPSVCEC